MDNKFKYAMVRIVCEGVIKTCKFCEGDSETIKEGYCAMCGRPLWKKPGERCGFILGYADKNYRQQDKVHIKCKFCNTVTTI
jgi:hypothetical protein